MPQAIDRLLATPMIRPRLPAIKPLLLLMNYSLKSCNDPVVRRFLTQSLETIQLL